MISLYTTPSCTSCRKAKAWLREHDLQFKERNIFANPLKKDELIAILKLCENGTEDIISTRSKIYQKLNLKFDEITLEELVDLMEKHPDLLRRPLIVEGQKLQIGYNEDDIRRFIPRDVRNAKFIEKRKQLFFINYQQELVKAK
ncbi:regulatory protein spx [Enterococcus sp. PF1-24]|uniref:transcriptional regulator Spx n=1 Tax=unclassified Enterococcus TaxID=2608891 RepID=UPI0024740950|nr:MULTISPECIES: transcriptional regulator Spx [unclassified Enterococcus]MDH6363801.1 regulatory protein spx [Enterococcus sp. PFB1-1]MDH6401013.1 regulatory protein spx [Enterococcus sp. PF1-24]